MEVALADQVLRLRVPDVRVRPRHVEVEVVEVVVAPVAEAEHEAQRGHLQSTQSECHGVRVLTALVDCDGLLSY